MDLRNDLRFSLPFLHLLKPKALRRVKPFLWLLMLVIPGGGWVISHAIAYRQALMMSASNRMGAYMTEGLVRSMSTLNMKEPAHQAPAPRTAPADDPSRPLILSIPNSYSNH